jgi:hypothetical protein
MYGRPQGGNAELSAFYGSVYPAVWSLQLALRSRGLGSTIVGYHLAGRERDTAELLGIPDDVTQVSMLAVGHTFTPPRGHPSRRSPTTTGGATRPEGVAGRRPSRRTWTTSSRWLTTPSSSRSRRSSRAYGCSWNTRALSTNDCSVQL